jgi:hypothetical protein
MLLSGGTLDGRRYLSAAAMTLLTVPQTGALPTGFFQSDAWGNRGTNYGWGIARSRPRLSRSSAWQPTDTSGVIARPPGSGPCVACLLR